MREGGGKKLDLFQKKLGWKWINFELFLEKVMEKKTLDPFLKKINESYEKNS